MHVFKSKLKRFSDLSLSDTVSDNYNVVHWPSNSNVKQSKLYNTRHLKVEDELFSSSVGRPLLLLAHSREFNGKL